MLLQSEVGLIFFEMYLKIVFDLYLTKISKYLKKVLLHVSLMLPL